MNAVINAICKQVGLQYLQHENVHGGDINLAFKVHTKNGFYFLKLNNANAYPAMFVKEAEGLQALQGKSPIKVPAVIAFGEYENLQWLLLEWLEKSAPAGNFWREFGAGLSLLHQNEGAGFGWENDNYIGSLFQSNKQCDNWAEFYTSQRILPLVKQLFDASLFTKNDIDTAEKLCNRFEEIFPPEKPSLLHGDLWSGNFMVTGSGLPAIYDPSVYYGHREMDICMTKLFGGFDSSFYDHYNESFPLEKDWRKRLPVTQLYPLLVHAGLFGGNYISRCRNIINDWK
ncbi:fructosamine kinase family protein [soil metagenome]